jgi:hypothetical protein
MIDALRRNYANTAAIIFAAPPNFDEILDSIFALDATANVSATVRRPDGITRYETMERQRVLGCGHAECSRNRI